MNLRERLLQLLRRPDYVPLAEPEIAQQLRLDNTAAGAKTGGGGGASWLPWVLALFLAITWAGIGIKEYKGAGNIRKSLAGGAPPPPSGTTTTGNPSTPAVGSGSTSASPVAAGTVVVAQKGVLIPTQQIAVSPIDVGGRVVELNVTTEGLASASSNRACVSLVPKYRTPVVLGAVGAAKAS